MIRCYTHSPEVFKKFRDQMLSHISDDKSKYDLTPPPSKDSGLRATNRITDGHIGNLARPAERPYYELVKSYIRPALKSYSDHYPKPTTVLISSLFWIEYSTGGHFDWHTHEGNNLTATIPVHIEDPDDFTEVHNYKISNATEGSILVLPASIPHRGRPTVGKKKIILGINLNIVCNGVTDSYKNAWGK